MSQDVTDLCMTNARRRKESPIQHAVGDVLLRLKVPPTMLAPDSAVELSMA